MKKNKVIDLKKKKLSMKIQAKKKNPSVKGTGKVVHLQERITILKSQQKDGKISITQRNQIIVEYMPMIRCVAKKISSKLPSHIDYEDLVSNGVIGLMDAIEKYDPTRNNKFKTYAEFRVRGTILDALRSQDWVPRSIRDKTKRITKVKKDLEQKYDRTPKPTEIAQALNVDMNKYHELVRETNKVSMVPIDDESSFFSKTGKFSVLKVLENDDSFFNVLNKKSIQKIIKNSIQELPERQRIVLSLYYYEEFNLKKIGEVLKITESRVSQLHAQAIDRLKSKLSTQINEDELKAA